MTFEKVKHLNETVQRIELTFEKQTVRRP